MHMDDRPASDTLAPSATASAEEEFAQLLAAPADGGPVNDPHAGGVRVGTLVGFTSDTHMPLVTYAGQPTAAAMAARATLDLDGRHIGRQVALLFENAEPCRPIIVGCLQGSHNPSIPDLPGQIEVDADGRRLVVSARDQIVLRCGQASITLTKEGKLIIQGAYVSSQSSGVLRIKGGSVQIN
jgi:hypothetical protein